MPSILAISTLMGLALAQTTTMQLPWPEYPLEEGETRDPNSGPDVAVSVVTANSISTVVKIFCADGWSDEYGDCGFFPYQTLTYGPSTWKMDMSVGGEGDFTMTQDCKTSGKDVMCVESASGTEANFPGSSTESYVADSLMVTVTAGVDKLKNAAKATPAASESQNVRTVTTAATGSAATQTLASVTQSGSTEASGMPAESTGAAVANMVTFGHGLVGAGVGLLAAFL